MAGDIKDTYGHVIGALGLAAAVAASLVTALYFGAIVPLNNRIENLLPIREHQEFRDRILRDQDRQDRELKTLREQVHELEKNKTR